MEYFSNTYKTTEQAEYAERYFKSKMPCTTIRRGLTVTVYPLC